MNDRQNLLSGLRVIDCGTYIAGPAAATMMSDFGAEVIKIEHPRGGDPYRYLSFLPGMPVSEHNYCWLLDARNKKSLAVDLRADAGRDVVRRLITTADVFITNYPPDLAERFQVRYQDIEPLNPRMIYAHITGYGDRGDDTNKPGYDTTAYWARSGLTGIMFDLTMATGATPCGTGDHPVALALFGAIMLALYQRQITGRGSKVSTSLMATGAWSN
ncbi:MAG: CoA transferase, partial [Blastocatellia bacterium]